MRLPAIRTHVPPTSHTAPKGVLVILHGLFGNGRNWSAIAKRLARGGWTVVAPDLRNHGTAPWDDTMTYRAMADDVRTLLEEDSPDRPAVVVGHSMGGKVAMRLALDAPERVRALVVVDIAPAAYRHDMGTLAEALKALPLSDIRLRSDADKALTPAIPDPAVRAFLLQNLDIPSQGSPHWRPNLDVLIDSMDAIAGWSAPSPNSRYAGPTLVLAGERSDYIRATHAQAFAALFPNARQETIAKAGHWVHAEQPEAFLAAVTEFLDALPSTPA